MTQLRAAFTAAALAALAVSSAAFAQSKAPDLGVGPFHINTDRGPVRKVDFSALKGPASNDVLAGPTNGLDSALLVYNRIAAGVGPKGLYSLPVDHTYLVLKGKLNVQIGTDTFVLEPESLALVPAGVPHRAWNAGAAPVDDFQAFASAPTRDLAGMMKPAVARKVENAAQYIRIPPRLDKLAGEGLHDSLNERILASYETGSKQVHERLNDVLPKGGRTVIHMHPFDQVYFVREGSLTLNYSYEKMEVGPDSLVVLPKGLPHSNENNGTGVQRLITLLLPAPPKGSPLGATAPWLKPPAQVQPAGQ